MACLEGKKLDEFEEIYKEARKKHPHLPERCTDQSAARLEAWIRFYALEDWAHTSGFIVDPRDKIMISVTLNILIFFPLTQLALILYPYHWVGIVLFLIKFIGFWARFILMMHYAEHRRVFKPDFMMHFFPSVLGLAFGFPPNYYWIHHIAMHHGENNIFPSDLSSTEPYQRDSFIHWLHYWAKYFTCLWMLPVYAWNAGRRRLAGTVLFSAAFYLSVMYIGFQWAPMYTFYNWILPFFGSSFVLMFGNFAQHIFVDPKVATMKNKKSLEFNCLLTYNCMNHIENLFTFNDGYHITHHYNSRCHWSEMATHFFKNIDKYAAAGAICFQDAHFVPVGFFVFTGQWKALAKRYVHLGPTKISEEEVIKKLKARLVPIHRTHKKVEKAGGGLHQEAVPDSKED